MAPLPKPAGQRRRRNATVAMTGLPAGGRKGAPPAWPFDVKATSRERTLWRRAWGTPQAVAWERLGWTDSVARYVRLLVATEAPGAPMSVMAEARALEDRLGLNPMAMLRLRWEVAPDEVAEARDHRAPRARLQAVDPDAGAG